MKQDNHNLLLNIEMVNYKTRLQFSLLYWNIHKSYFLNPKIQEFNDFFHVEYSYLKELPNRQTRGDKTTWNHVLIPNLDPFRLSPLYTKSSPKDSQDKMFSAPIKFSKDLVDTSVLTNFPKLIIIAQHNLNEPALISTYV